MARIHSTGLMSKNTVSFGDLYNIMQDLNKQVRIGDSNGGKLRVQEVAAGDIVGVPSFSIPKSIFKTLSTIADNINQIKMIENEALRKTQAVQLASFAYNMTLSEHVFNDGNGRTCRMFADTILQTFGLPPHIPQPELLTTPVTIGGVIDFEKGTRAFLQGIRQSDRILQQEKERIKQLPGEKERLDSQVTSLEDSVKKLAQEARTKLDELKSVAKDGHKNGQEYTEMYNALKAVSELDPSKNNIGSVEEAISKLAESSKEYERTHTGLFKGRSGLHPDGMSGVKAKSVKSKKINNLDLNEEIKIEKSKNPDFEAGSTHIHSNSMKIKRNSVNSKCRMWAEN